MTTDQWLRGLPYLVLGITTLAFSGSMFIRAWCRGEQPWCPGWPPPWDALSGTFLLSIAIVAFTNVGRVFGEWSRRSEYRAAYVALWFCALMCVWTFWRWWNDDTDA
jgi:hypothetical protein